MNVKRAEEALRDVIYPDKPEKITPSYIVEVVAEHFGVSVDMLLSDKRNKGISYPRQIVMYLCDEMTDYSLYTLRY